MIRSEKFKAEISCPFVRVPVSAFVSSHFLVPYKESLKDGIIDITRRKETVELEAIHKSLYFSNNQIKVFEISFSINGFSGYAASHVGRKDD